MCVSACTMVAHDAQFAGPAAFNRVFTLEEDRRDAGHAERQARLAHEDALVRCHGQGNCTAVCPMEISPTDSILALRRRAVLHLFR
jgi:succinate dehydrogenase/fumarate reductase-like Fe-S protein